MLTLKENFEQRKSAAGQAWLKCPFCGHEYRATNIDGSWKDFFRFDVKRGFWQLIYFGLKLSVIFILLFYVVQK